MQDKQKVTLYLPPRLHRQLKIRAAVELDSMSSMVERAVVFYLGHPEVVEQVEEESYGKTHQVYNCPECHNSLVIDGGGEVVSLKEQPSILAEELPVEKVREEVGAHTCSQGEKLVPC